MSQADYFEGRVKLRGFRCGSEGGVERRGFRCETERGDGTEEFSVLNRGVFGVELRDFRG